MNIARVFSDLTDSFYVDDRININLSCNIDDQSEKLMVGIDINIVSQNRSYSKKITRDYYNQDEQYLDVMITEMGDEIVKSINEEIEKEEGREI